MPHIYTEGDRVELRCDAAVYRAGDIGTITRVLFGSQFLFDYEVTFDDGGSTAVHEDEITYSRYLIPSSVHSWYARVWWRMIEKMHYTT